MKTKRFEVYVGLSLLILGTGLFFLSYHRYFLEGKTFEFCHYAEIARNILSGRGYVTQCFYPSELRYFIEQNIPVTPFGPILHRFPLYAYWCAGWMKLAGVTDFGMALANGTAHAIWASIVFLIARFFFNRFISVSIAVLWLVHPMMLAGYVLAGHPDVLYGALFCLFNFLWWRSIKESAKEGLLLGALAGLLFLSRQSFLFFAPLYAIHYLYFCPNKSKKWFSIYFLTTITALSLPWFLYLYLKTNTLSSPLLLGELADSTLIWKMPWMEYRTFQFQEFLNYAFLKNLMTKFLIYFSRVVKDFPTAWQGTLFSCSMVIALVATKDKELKSFLRFNFILFIWQLVVFSFLRYENLGFLSLRYYLWLAPITLISFFGVLYNREKVLIRAGYWTGLFIQLVWWAGIYWHLPKANSEWALKNSLKMDSAWKELASLTHEESSFVASNVSTAISWYLKTPTVNIPNRVETLKLMQKDYRISKVFLSSNEAGELYNYPDWKNFH